MASRIAAGGRRASFGQLPFAAVGGRIRLPADDRLLVVSLRQVSVHLRCPGAGMPEVTLNNQEIASDLVESGPATVPEVVKAPGPDLSTRAQQ